MRVALRRPGSEIRKNYYDGSRRSDGFTSESMDAHREYLRNAVPGTGWILRAFHNGRIRDFADFIDEGGGRVLSVGCGTGELEKRFLAEKFDEVYGLEPVGEKLRNFDGTDVQAIQGAVPPIPFEDDSLDAVVAVGVTEHLPDEHGFLTDAIRCLRPGGNIYLTIPIEVGTGGLIRHLGRSVASPKRKITSNDWRRFFEYSTEELLKQTSRDAHGTSHKYYNYRYAAKDLNRYYEDVTLVGWPFDPLKTTNLILFAKARAPEAATTDPVSVTNA